VSPAAVAALFATLLGVLFWVPSAGAQTEPRRVAVFDAELWDTSGEGEKPEQAARLAMLDRVLHERLAAEPGYAMVDLTTFRPEIDRQRPLFRCGACQLDIAHRAGARYALNVIVRKMSTLIQEMALILADVEKDEIASFHSVSIRNNSDEAWHRGLVYILDNGLLGRSGR
jgi:hypothetical protein